jgi:peptidoglycan/LPS O-acetylase OafA/YrhL
VSAVLIGHFFPFDNPIRTTLPLGWLGVRLFYVISGFLITGILLEGRQVAAAGVRSVSSVLRRFYVRRVLRIMPAYYGVLALALALGVEGLREELPWHLTFTSNIYYAIEGRFTGPAFHLWSLSVEEQFYLVWPWIVIFTPRRHMTLVMLGAIATALVWRIAGTWVGWPGITVLAPTPGCLDTLGLGGLLALSLRGETAISRRTIEGVGWLLGLPLAALLLHFHTNGTGVATRTILNDLAMGLVFVAVVNRALRGVGGPIGWLLDLPPVRYVGKISYGIYLIHLFVLQLSPRLFESLGLNAQNFGVWPATFTLLALTVGAATISWYAFEKPINGLKRHFSYSDRDATEDPARDEANA